MSRVQPPPSGPGRRAARPATARPRNAAGVRRPVGSGRGGKVRARDLRGGAKARHIAKKTAKWAAILGFSGFLLAAIAVYVTYKMVDIPNPNTDFQAQTTTVYYSDGKHVLGQFALQNRESIPLAQMPKSLRDAALSAEDRSFETNKGLDPKSIARAAWSNFQSDGTTQGASTITQQYVKILYLSQERTWKRKIKEAFLAVKVQNTLTKNEVLEGYLNTIYFGRGAYGVQAAAQAFFDKDAQDLTVRESAVLASVLNSPGNFDPAISRGNRQRLLDRYRYVLSGMVDMGNLDAGKAAKLGRRLPAFPEVKEINKFGGQKGYLLTLVQSALTRLKFSEEEINGGGLKVVTTLDWDDERAAIQAVKRIRPKGKSQLHVSLSAVEPGTGALRAMIGGRNYTGKGPQDQVNLALAPTPVGSTFKPFALTAALRDGFTLRDRFDGSSPLRLPDGSTVRNEGESSGIPDGISYGTVDLLKATEDSINTAYVDMTLSMKDGPRKVLQAATQAGVPADSPGLDPYGRIALGSASIRPVEMAESYATFAAGGQAASWYVVEKVSDANGQRYAHRDRSERAFSAAVMSNVSYALQQVVKDGTGQNARALQRPAAGKTGTATATQRNGDQRVVSSWFVGYTPQLATSVSYTRGDGTRPLDGYLDTFFGADYPTQTWTAFMRAALQGEPVEDFPEPARLQGENPTYSPPPTTFAPSTTTFAPPTTTNAPPTTTTTSAPPTTTTSAPPTTTTTSAPPTTTTAPPPPPTTTAPPPPPTTTAPLPTTPSPAATPPRGRETPSSP